LKRKVVWRRSLKDRFGKEEALEDARRLSKKEEWVGRERGKDERGKC